MALRASKANRCRPALERLDTRELMAAGVSAGLVNGVLSVTGASATTPIVIGVNAMATSRGPVGCVVVEGVGIYPAAQVRTVVITKPASEPLRVHRGSTWNPSFRLTLSNPAPANPTPTPAPAPAPTPGPQATALESAAEQAIVDAVNAARKQNGQTPLKVNSKLAQAAQIHAQDMARLDRMEHELTGASLPTLLDRAHHVGYAFSTLGENIAYNYDGVASVMTGWMNSPGHRANILSADYTEIGVGIATNARGEPYYCQVFGRPS